MNRWFLLGLLLLASSLFVLGQSGFLERRLLFFPTHHTATNGLQAWKVEGELIGYCRAVSQPKHVWLMLHGNAGQASDRVYAMPCFSQDDSVYVMEYPGYGQRKGSPSRNAFDAAAKQAYAALCKQFPKTPIGVVSESIGSGPACVLAGQSPPPAKLVLIVPFDCLESVARDHFPGWLVRLCLKADWDNIKALQHYRGPVDIFAATDDHVIPIQHARNLANHVRQAVFHQISGGHNDWSTGGEVKVRMGDALAGR